MLGGRLFVQWANLETGSQQSNAIGITTTNALDITLASSMPSGALSTVYSEAVGPSNPFPNTGVVFVSRGPVMMFEAQ